MSTLDLHPEDLLDKAEEGALTPGESELLEAHMALCRTCRFERAARLEFRGERDAALPPARKPSLSGAIAMAVHERTAAPRSAPTPPRRSRWAVLLVPIAAVLVASGAAAALSHATYGGRTFASLFAPTVDRSGDSPSPRAKMRIPTVGSSPTRAAEPTVPPSVDAAPIEAAPQATVTASTHARAPHARASARLPPPPPTVESPAARAASLFADASAARARGDRGVALTLYRTLMTELPTTREAHAARALMGRLLLDQGDASAALAAFDAYLAGTPGALDEEAQVGRALALGRLRRPSEEAAAWSALLDAHPATPHAARARARLEELGAR